MRPFAVIAIGLLILGLSSGCYTLTAYVDTGFRAVGYEDLDRSRKGPALGTAIEFQRDGQPFPPVTGQAREAVIRALNDAKLFSSVSSGVVNTDAILRITINNSGGETRGSGTVTGLTGGAVGTRTTDRYVFTAVYEVGESQPTTREYQHAIHSTLGSAAAPEGIEPMTIDQAFDAVVEQVVLRLLFDLQQSGAM